MKAGAASASRMFGSTGSPPGLVPMKTTKATTKRSVASSPLAAPCCSQLRFFS